VCSEKTQSTGVGDSFQKLTLGESKGKVCRRAPPEGISSSCPVGTSGLLF
jgi:hypothetical protein